jgi:hypothetical protein
MKHLKGPLFFLLIFSILMLSLLCLSTNTNAKELPKEWKLDGNKMPIILNSDTPHLVGFNDGIADFEEKWRKVDEKLGRDPLRRAQMLDNMPRDKIENMKRLEILAGQNIIGIRIAVYVDLLPGEKITIMPNDLEISFADGRKCRNLGTIVYISGQPFNTDIQGQITITQSYLNHKQPLQLVIFVPKKFNKPHAKVPSEMWVTKVTITSPPANAVVSGNTEKGR